MATIDTPVGRRPPLGPDLGAPPLPKKEPKWLTAAGQVWGILTLGGATIRAIFTPPFSWRGEFVDQAWMLAKRASIPAAISAFGFGYGAPGVQGSLIAELLGDPTRVAAIVGPATVREQAVWITGMIVAGVAGTAMCADLGARKVRDELAALQVMGVDPVRELVAPRVLAITLLMPAIGIVVITTEAFAILLANLQVTSTVGGYFEAVSRSFTTIDLVANLVKTSVSGAIVGLVCCYKGMNAKGGPVGVGRAVNQAVVISFVLIWVLNFAFNSTYLGAFPGAQAVR
ncbi:MAG: phospholipid/cholesterol/gamma-HCH transport system permease protein [Baekduia sp.]|nr:phospholipid/cholesterol/gamma-HCH transport system permease protein [Baekduia sp.]